MKLLFVIAWNSFGSANATKHCKPKKNFLQVLQDMLHAGVL